MEVELEEADIGVGGGEKGVGGTGGDKPAGGAVGLMQQQGIAV